MSGLPEIVRPMFELLDTLPTVDVKASEFERLLGYPAGHTMGEREAELATNTREFYARNGRPWVYVREVELFRGDRALRLDGVEFDSQRLSDYLGQAGASRAVLVAVSAGRKCEEQARRLWEESKPDEYFFLEVYGSAVVEHLVAGVSGRICALAEGEGLMAVPHYSPGYSGWDIADQAKLFELITGGMAMPLPEPVEVLPSGMLSPKKSLIAVVGLTARTSQNLALPRLVPCETCSFSPCQYRRAPYRHSLVGAPASGVTWGEASRPARAETYTVNAKALRKWARERVRIEHRGDGAVDVHFRFDGTTCSNQGRPLAFDYHVALEASARGYSIVRMDCRPAPDDEGHKQMCAYLSDGEALMGEIGREQPLRGRPLSDVLRWERPSVPSGCYCSAESRAHKWGLALEVIHFALGQPEAGAESSPLANSQ
jgi:hypothetical protein